MWTPLRISHCWFSAWAIWLEAIVLLFVWHFEIVIWLLNLRAQIIYSKNVIWWFVFGILGFGGGRGSSSRAFICVFTNVFLWDLFTWCEDCLLFWVAFKGFINFRCLTRFDLGSTHKLIFLRIFDCLIERMRFHVVCLRETTWNWLLSNFELFIILILLLCFTWITTYSIWK